MIGVTSFSENTTNISQDNSKAFSKRVFQLISNSIARVTINSFSGTIVNGVGLVIGEILEADRDSKLQASIKKFQSNAKAKRQNHY